MASSSVPQPGFKYVVAVDESHYSRWAFNLALSHLDKHTDTLVVLAVAQLMSSGYGYTEAIHAAQVQEENRCKRIVRAFGRKCKEAGVVNMKLVLTYGTDIGESIVNYLNEHPSDFLYIGRRSLGSFKRLFLGSVSKHVLEHAPCTVTIVKQAFGPEELHVNKDEVLSLEEAERQRRIKEYDSRHAKEAEWLAKKHVLQELHHSDDE
ncbi:MAG: universal stress protein [archaeon]|nr:universal stress protein [archaeon]